MEFSEIYQERQSETNKASISKGKDALENLFGAIRAGCGSGDNPTTFQFIGSLKTQILNGLSGFGLSGANCQADEHELLSNLQEFVNVKQLPSQKKQISVMSPSPLQSEPQQLYPHNSTDDIISALDTDVILQFRYFVCGIHMSVVF